MKSSAKSASYRSQSTSANVHRIEKTTAAASKSGRSAERNLRDAAALLKRAGK